MTKKIIVSKSAEETRELGRKFARNLGASSVVALYGELGSGKTTFTKGLAEGFGIKKRILSPTFVVVRTYKLKAKSSKRKTKAQNSKLLYHIDLYRLSSPDDLKSLGIDEILNSKESIVVIEWPEKMGSRLPQNRWDVRFEYIDENRRRIEISKIKY